MLTAMSDYGFGANFRTVFLQSTMLKVPYGAATSSEHAWKEISHLSIRGFQPKPCVACGQCISHNQSGLLNSASLSRSMTVDAKTIGRYIDLLVDLRLARRLQPYLVNVGNVL